jgi:hypothetical protein
MSFDCEAARKRCEAATPGPWLMLSHGIYADDVLVLPTDDGMDPDNEQFISYARTDLPAALDEIAALLAENWRMRQALSDVRAWIVSACNHYGDRSVRLINNALASIPLTAAEAERVRRVEAVVEAAKRRTGHCDGWNLGDTLREMAAICEAVANDDPISRSGSWYPYCLWCDATGEFGPLKHHADCLWVRARKLRGKA